MNDTSQIIALECKYLTYINHNMYICVVENFQNMHPKKKKQLILSLIKDDLISAKLLRGLSKAGLDADRYCLFLSGTIFDLLGFPNTEKSDEIFSEYIKLTEQSDNVDIRETPNTLDGLANEIYVFLVRKARKTL